MINGIDMSILKRHSLKLLRIASIYDILCLQDENCMSSVKQGFLVKFYVKNCVTVKMSTVFVEWNSFFT